MAGRRPEKNCHYIAISSKNGYCIAIALMTGHQPHHLLHVEGDPAIQHRAPWDSGVTLNQIGLKE